MTTEQGTTIKDRLLRFAAENPSIPPNQIVAAFARSMGTTAETVHANLRSTTTTLPSPSTTPVPPTLGSGRPTLGGGLLDQALGFLGSPLAAMQDPVRDTQRRNRVLSFDERRRLGADPDTGLPPGYDGTRRGINWQDPRLDPDWVPPGGWQRTPGGDGQPSADPELPPVVTPPDAGGDPFGGFDFGGQPEDLLSQEYGGRQNIFFDLLRGSPLYQNVTPIARRALANQFYPLSAMFSLQQLNAGQGNDFGGALGNFGDFLRSSPWGQLGNFNFRGALDSLFGGGGNLNPLAQQQLTHDDPQAFTNILRQIGTGGLSPLLQGAGRNVIDDFLGAARGRDRVTPLPSQYRSGALRFPF